MTVQELIDNGAEFVLALSYGKDSLRSLAAIKKLGWPLHRIVHREIWATDTIPADLPPMVEFKAVADKWILDNFGITVEHVCATERQVSAGGGTPYLRETILQSQEKRKNLWFPNRARKLVYITT